MPYQGQEHPPHERVAAFNGWGTGMLAFCSVPFAFFGLTGMLATCELSAVAYNEFRGRKRLLQFDPSGASVLSWNQVGLLARLLLKPAQYTPRVRLSGECAADMPIDGIRVQQDFLATPIPYSPEHIRTLLPHLGIVPPPTCHLAGTNFVFIAGPTPTNARHNRPQTQATRPGPAD